jgi:hypothetical protein
VPLCVGRSCACPFPPQEATPIHAHERTANTHIHREHIHKSTQRETGKQGVRRSFSCNLCALKSVCVFVCYTCGCLSLSGVCPFVYFIYIYMCCVYLSISIYIYLIYLYLYIYMSLYALPVWRVRCFVPPSPTPAPPLPVSPNIRAIKFKKEKGDHSHHTEI